MICLTASAPPPRLHSDAEIAEVFARDVQNDAAVVEMRGILTTVAKKY